MQHDTVPTAQVQFHHKLAHTITAYNIQDCHRHLSITMRVAQVYPFCNPTANCPSSEVYVCNCAHSSNYSCYVHHRAGMVGIVPITCCSE